jgi:hypothetical protein
MRIIAYTYSHRLQIVLVALAKFGTDECLRLGHVLNGALHGDYALQVETGNIIYAENNI